MSEYILELNGITKIFPGIRALDNVNFNLKPGEIHALMGENGAGKSTFIKVITGVHMPDGGEIRLNGEKIEFTNPRDAMKVGIAAIYQHVTCYPDLSITENMFMDHMRLSKKTGRILWKEMHEEAGKLLKTLGADLDPKSLMGELSVAQQQIVEIAKALSAHAKIIIMDEPTAALTKRESEELYEITKRLRDQGASIIFISHRFEDIYEIADRVTVLRDAKYIGTWNVSDISTDKLIVAMVGREITQMYPPKTSKIGDEVFRVENLSKTGYFADVSFSVRRGEIVAITGLVGAGRTETCQSIFGIMPADSGKIFLEGKEVRIRKPIDAMRLGIGHLPEDRQKQGLILNWSISRNITLSSLEKFSKHGWLRPKMEDEKARELAKKVNVKALGVEDLANSLSGGNQQKVVVAKLLVSDLKVIFLDEPTKGVDVGAKYAIYEIMDALAAQGYGIVMVSSEMPEVLGMADTIVVMRHGRVSKTIQRADATQEIILEAAISPETAAAV